MKIAVPREIFPGERRVALIPANIPALVKAGHEVMVEQGAGASAGYPDHLYAQRGAELTDSRDTLFQQAEVLFMVRGPEGESDQSQADLARLENGQILIAFLDPLSDLEAAQALATSGVTAFALELLPRITRAQSMDALSSMASLAGYKAALLAANALPKIFPMMITAAGSLSPARVFVVGAGVTGLQACSTAKRLGALVSAYDVREVVKEQVQSVGAQFVEFDLEIEDSEDQGGYARSQSEIFYQRQQEAMAKVIAESDVVITTAAVPGKQAPILVSAAMVEGMAPGSVIVDAAAERGGNCALTEPGKTVVKHGVTIVGLKNLPAMLPYHASQMLSRNITALFDHLTDMQGMFSVNMREQITAETLLCRDGQITNARVREAMGLAASE